MPYTANSVLTTCVGTLHTVGWLQKLVRHQAEEYLDSYPYCLGRNLWLKRHIRRLTAQPSAKGATKNGIATFPDIMHEDLLLTISDNLMYRKTVIEQATGYKNELLPDFTDCQDLDLEGALYHVCNLPKPDPKMSLKERQDRVASHLSCVQTLDRNVELVAKANLFVLPSSGQRRHQEQKPIVYLALVMAIAENFDANGKQPTTARKQIEELKTG